MFTKVKRVSPTKTVRGHNFESEDNSAKLSVGEPEGSKDSTTVRHLVTSLHAENMYSLPLDHNEGVTRHSDPMCLSRLTAGAAKRGSGVRWTGDALVRASDCSAK